MRTNSKEDLPVRVRASLGTAVILGLSSGKLDAPPTTAYLMTYRKEKCMANCGFCSQARSSSSRADLLSRVSWPVFHTRQVLSGLQDAVEHSLVKRACIQTLNYPEAMKHLRCFVKAIREQTDIAVSVSCQPKSIEDVKQLDEAGAERISIPLDAATEKVFNRVKGAAAEGPYDWTNQLTMLEESLTTFGKGRVGTHLIFGLGETEKEMITMIQSCVDIGILPALFAFTPISGTALEGKPQPTIQRFRHIQLARNLLVRELSRLEDMEFDEEERLTDYGLPLSTLRQIIQSGEPFITSGCPSCNRPYYNEKPSGPIYNYPRKLTKKEVADAFRQLRIDEDTET